MRANTKRKHEMGKRFAIVIGVAAAGVMALGAQTVMALGAQTASATEAPAVVEYNTKLTITTERGFLYHGSVWSGRTECMDGREVTLFKQRPGADLILATFQSEFVPRYPGKRGRAGGDWGFARGPEASLHRVYAKVSPMVGDGFVCRADRSPNICSGRAKRGLMCDPRLAVGTKGYPHS
jgi:hypothetical protein